MNPRSPLPVGYLVAAFIALVASSVSLASFEFIVVAMQTDLGFSSDAANTLQFAPAAASLLVVFVAGALSDRWGPRPVMLLGTVAYTAGAAMVGLAPGLGMVIVGRSLGGIGSSAMAIVALAAISRAVTDPGQRARVFGLYGAATPAVFLMSPPLSAVIVSATNWRMGVVPWVVLGVASLLTTLRFVPRQEAAEGREALTPLIAGLALTGVTLGITYAPINGRTSAALLGIGLVAVAAWVVVARRIATPSLDLRWTRGPGISLLLVALVVAAMPNLFFYTNLLLQYRYNVPLVTIAVLLIIPQAMAVAGGLASGPVSARFGPARTTVAALVLCAVTSLATLLVTPQAPIWVPVMALALSAGPIAFVVGPITEALLDRAPESASGVASSVRKAAWTVGGCIGGALLGAVGFSQFQSRLADILNTTSLTPQQAYDIARDIRGGAILDQLAPTIPSAEAQRLLVGEAAGLLEAQSSAFALVGAISAAIYLAAAVIVALYVRRHESSASPNLPN